MFDLTLEFCYVICLVYRRSVLVVFLGVDLLFRYSAALLMFHYSMVFQLFCLCSVVPSVFRCSTSKFFNLLYEDYSVKLNVVYRNTWFGNTIIIFVI